MHQFQKKCLLRDNNLILHLNIVTKNEFVSIPFQIPFEHLAKLHKTHEKQKGRVSVQGVKSLGGHFACLCQILKFMK